MIRITMKTHNAAFHDSGDQKYEVASILDELAWRIRNEGVEPYVRLIDSNGNAVGSMQVDEE